MTGRRCLVLGSKFALDRIAPALDQALAALELERTIAPTPREIIAGEILADVVVAEISKPSPTIAYELGVAATKRIPIAYLAATGSTPPPIFAQYLAYDADAATPKLAYSLAKYVEAVLQTSGPREPQEQLAEGWIPRYRLGESFMGVVTHVDPDGGYVLVNTIGRPPAMLHVSSMTPQQAEALKARAMGPGVVTPVQVYKIDHVRGKVLVREVGDSGKSGLRLDERDRLASSLLEQCEVIEALIPTVEIEDADFIAGIIERIRRLRRVRNDVAHGVDVPAAELGLAATEATLTAIRLGRMVGRQGIEP